MYITLLCPILGRAALFVLTIPLYGGRCQAVEAGWPSEPRHFLSDPTSQERESRIPFTWFFILVQHSPLHRQHSVPPPRVPLKAPFLFVLPYMLPRVHSLVVPSYLPPGLSRGLPVPLHLPRLTQCTVSQKQSYLHGMLLLKNIPWLLVTCRSKSQTP